MEHRCTSGKERRREENKERRDKGDGKTRERRREEEIEATVVVGVVVKGVGRGCEWSSLQKRREKVEGSMK